MSAEVVMWPGVTRLDLPAERILDMAREAGLEKVVIVGLDAGGEEFFASSIADGGHIVWLFERAKLKLLRIVDEPA